MVDAKDKKEKKAPPCAHNFKFLREEVELVAGEKKQWIVERCMACNSLRYLPKKVGLTVPKSVAYVDLKIRY